MISEEWRLSKVLLGSPQKHTVVIVDIEMVGGFIFSNLSVYLVRSRIRNPHRSVRQNTMANSTMKGISNGKCIMVRPFIRTHDLVQRTLSNVLLLTQSLTSKIPGKDENGEEFSVLVLVSSQMMQGLLCSLKWYGHYPGQTPPPLNSENGFWCPLNLGLSCQTIDIP